ncbi:NADH dehydrogenase [ubiquinone] 1 beta subcomplex subunit 11, mitochondrial [Cimex lectularius]|uniref:NADH dehydrogenase [ubiquinone] 1 beta subcomplex subunit 11, mitochondrial n=1 Tax=Cimex lectularius TaxID=79782 RepID=A0A8I6RFT1_CIMLE|nr:NADH dehydrogenase [ubiquinone] 1 beta subcomplex subunit 11, mitochondrial [Cimex lectularius]
MMSALTRVARMRSLIPLANQASARNISTSKKKNETATAANPFTVEALQESKTKAWVSYGFCNKDETEDRYYMHMSMFCFVTVATIFTAFGLAYRPSIHGLDWAQREAFLELRRRERLGLPLVDPNYLPLDQIVLPDDEVLGTTEIIV